MSLFGKKTYQENKYALPYGIVLATAFFLAMIVFSICYGNKEYMADVMGREFEKNIIGQTSFMAGGFALILILDYGLSFSFDRKEKRRLVDIIGLSAASLEWLWVFACSLIYIINWQGERGTFEFTLRIVTMIVIYLVMGVNILSRVPKFRDFEELIQGHGQMLIYLTIIGLIGLVNHMMMWTVLARNSNTLALAVNFISMFVDALMIAAPFVLNLFADEKIKGPAFGLVASIITLVLMVIFTLVMVVFYKQELEPLVYREFYWAMFVYSFDNILRVAAITYYGIIYKQYKK